MKTHATSIIFLAVGILFSVSCSKEAAPKVAPVPDVMFREKVEPSEVFTVQRDGEKATVQLLLDFSGCKSIEISRNTTGVAKNRYRAAELKPQVRQYEDTLPDAKAYWYWVRVFPHNGSSKPFGPIRVAADTENKGTYEKIPEVYPWMVSRTFATATISWEFPNVKYQSITIYRNTKRDSNRRKTVYETIEWHGDMEDQLPDTEADYWYWIAARLENGAVISQGPLKAEFAKQ